MLGRVLRDVELGVELFPRLPEKLSPQLVPELSLVLHKHRPEPGPSLAFNRHIEPSREDCCLHDQLSTPLETFNPRRFLGNPSASTEGAVCHSSCLFPDRKPHRAAAAILFHSPPY